MCTNILIIMYCLGLFIVVLTRTTLYIQDLQHFRYDVARRVSEPHMSSIIIFRESNSKKEKKKEKEKMMKNLGTHIEE